MADVALRTNTSSSGICTDQGTNDGGNITTAMLAVVKALSRLKLLRHLFGPDCPAATIAGPERTGTEHDIAANQQLFGRGRFS
jgi:hypothetical protein